MFGLVRMVFPVTTMSGRTAIVRRMRNMFGFRSGQMTCLHLWRETNHNGFLSEWFTLLSATTLTMASSLEPA